MITLSIIIPIYNEEDRLPKTFEALLELVLPRGIKLDKIIFVNDGSKDNSVLKIKKASIRLERLLRTKIEIISDACNHGKGFAVRSGMMRSNSDYTLFSDADMSTPFDELQKFRFWMKAGYDVIIGTRKNGQSTILRNQPIYRQILGKVFTFLSNIILGTWISDFTCGFKLFSKNAKDKIFASQTVIGWGFDAEILYIASKLPLKFQEIPVVWSNDSRSKVMIFKDAPKTLYDLFKIRIHALTGTYGDEIRPTFFKPSHAFMRK